MPLLMSAFTPESRHSLRQSECSHLEPGAAILNPTKAGPTGLDVGDLLKSQLCDFASIAERAETSGVSYFAQIPDGQRRKQIIIDTPSQSVRSSIQAEAKPIRVSWPKYHASSFNSAGRVRGLVFYKE